MKSIDDLFPRITLKALMPIVALKGWQIRRITRDNPYGGYTSGYLITDDLGSDHRWSSLQDFKINCIDCDRDIDGFMR